MAENSSNQAKDKPIYLRTNSKQYTSKAIHTQTYPERQPQRAECFRAHKITEAHAEYPAETS